MVSAGNYLAPGTQLYMGQSIRSYTGKYSLTMQADGNLVMYRNDGTVRYRFAKNGWFAAMQTDGNFVEYNGMMSPIWNSGTGGHPGSIVAVQDDGNLVVYSSGGIPLWNIGAEPGPKDPRLHADVVGRDLDVAVGNFLGHIGLYDGGGNVIEAVTNDEDQNGIRIVSLNQFKSTTHNFWGTASANIPSGFTEIGCYQIFCSYDGRDFEQLQMRIAMVRFALLERQLGSTYTLSPSWYSGTWDVFRSLPVRGSFRSDSFVVATMSMPGRYASRTTSAINWENFIRTLANSSIRTPNTVFASLSAYR